MLDFICIAFAELWGTEKERKTQNENICPRRESNQRSPTLQLGVLDHSAVLLRKYVNKFTRRFIKRKKKGNLYQYYEKTYTNRKFENQGTTQKRHHKLRLHNDGDRLRTFSLSNNSHLTDVIKPGLKGINLPTHRNSSVIKQTRHSMNIVYNTNRLLPRWIHFKNDLK